MQDFAAMLKKEMLNTKEVAEYLNINEKQVYRLIKERKIPATRITGKWLFPKRLIDEWIMTSARESISIFPKRRSLDHQVVIAGSDDIALALLTKKASIQHPNYTVSISNVGSLGDLLLSIMEIVMSLLPISWIRRQVSTTFLL